MLRHIITALSLLFLSTTLSIAQLVDSVSNGSIDWQQRMIIATGFGAPNKNMPPETWEIGSRKAAEIDAMATLLGVVTGITIDASVSVENFMTTHQEISAKVKGVLRNFKVIATRTRANGLTEVDVGIPIDGNLANCFIPDLLEKKPPLRQPQQQKPQEPEKSYTGLIIDARGLGVRPAMLPKVINENGEEVYGTGYVSRDYAVNQGIVGYSKQMDMARDVRPETVRRGWGLDARVGANPMVIKAIESSGSRRTDTVISNDDAQRLHSMDSYLKLMHECKVVFLVD